MGKRKQILDTEKEAGTRDNRLRTNGIQFGNSRMKLFDAKMRACTGEGGTAVDKCGTRSCRSVFGTREE